LGDFGAKYETENSKLKVYNGFYAHNRKTGNMIMIFFREDEPGKPYKLNSYMTLKKKKSDKLKNNHQLLD
jgi:hypothetical protein